MTEWRWRGAPPPFRRRVVVVAPHPDDEVLGCAGIMCWLASQGVEIEIVAVTDGEASHAQSLRVTREELVRRRAKEREAALRELGLDHVLVTRLGFPDAEVAGTEKELAGLLRDRMCSTTTVLVPWRHDGHPDHEAIGRAGRAAAMTTGAAYLEVPIWARVRGERRRPSFVLELGEFQARKRRATSVYRSQIVALGPDPCDGPVVHPHELELLASSEEWLVESS